MDAENMENFDPENDVQTSALQRRKNRFKKLAERTNERDSEFDSWSKDTKPLEIMSEDVTPTLPRIEQLSKFSNPRLEDEHSVESTTSSSVISESNRATLLSTDELKVKYGVKSSGESCDAIKPLTPVNREIQIKPKLEPLSPKPPVRTSYQAPPKSFSKLPTSKTAPNFTKFQKPKISEPAPAKINKIQHPVKLKSAMKSPEKEDQPQKDDQPQKMTRSVSVRDRINALKSSGLNVTFRKEKPAEILRKFKNKGNKFNEESTPVITEENESEGEASQKDKNSEIENFQENNEYSEETYKSDAEDDGFKTCRDEAEFTQLGSLGGNSPAFLCGNSFFKSNTPVKNSNLQTPKLDAMTEEFENQNLVNNQNDDTPKRRRDTEIITDVDTAFTFLKDKVSVEMVSKTQSGDGLMNLEKGENVRNTTEQDHLISTIRDQSLTDPCFNPNDLSTDQSNLSEPVIDMSTAHGKRLAAWYYDDNAKFDSIGNTPKKVKTVDQENSNTTEEKTGMKNDMNLEHVEKNNGHDNNSDLTETNQANPNPAKSHKRKHVSHEEDENDENDTPLEMQSLNVLANTPTDKMNLYSHTPEKQSSGLQIFSPVISTMDTTTASENANETIAYKLHKSPKKLKTEILKNIAENDNKINKSSPVPTKRYSLLPPSLPSGVHNTPESKSYVNQNEIILEKISGSSSQSTENHTIETLTTASSDNPHNSMDETQMISNQVYISELQNDARNEIFRHETLIKQTSHLIAATENSKNNNNTGSLKPPGNSKSSDSKSENNYDIESEERIVEANRLLLISNEEIERLNSRIQNLNSDDYKILFNSHEFGKRVGSLNIKNIRLPVQFNMIPDDFDVNFVLAARDITPRQEFFEVITSAKSMRRETKHEGENGNPEIQGSVLSWENISIDIEKPLPADFFIRLELYAYCRKWEDRNSVKHLKNAQKSAKKSNTGLSKFITNKLKPSNYGSAKDAIKMEKSKAKMLERSGFELVGFCEINLTACKNRPATNVNLDKPESHNLPIPFVPIGGRLLCNLQTKYQNFENFESELNFYKEFNAYDNQPPTWKRKKCIINSVNQLVILPIEMNEIVSNQAMHLELLKCCTPLPLNKLSRTVCARQFSFELDFLAEAPMTKVTYRFCADTKQHLASWLKFLNKRMDELRRWHPNSAF